MGFFWGLLIVVGFCMLVFGLVFYFICCSSKGLVLLLVNFVLSFGMVGVLLVVYEGFVCFYFIFGLKSFVLIIEVNCYFGDFVVIDGEFMLGLMLFFYMV